MDCEFDPDFGSALDAAAAIRARKISSVELTEHLFRRIDAFQPTLNAYAYQLREEALVSARQADEATAHKAADDVFHGVPINVKESFAVRGQPCTWGIPELKHSKAPADATAVQRLRKAGAILLGATNVPLHLMDDQTFNGIYGTSTNPWDLERTRAGRRAARGPGSLPGWRFSVLARMSQAASENRPHFTESTDTSRRSTL